jgi:hypothetical protein
MLVSITPPPNIAGSATCVAVSNQSSGYVDGAAVSRPHEKKPRSLGTSGAERCVTAGPAMTANPRNILCKGSAENAPHG